MIRLSLLTKMIRNAKLVKLAVALALALVSVATTGNVDPNGIRDDEDDSII